jgi:uncharacterized protein
VPTGSEAEEAKIAYLDSSVALHLVAAASPEGKAWFDDHLRSGVPVVSSKLLQLEVLRALRRDGVDPHEADALLSRVTLLGVDTELFDEAAAIEPQVKSLDALHLATCRRIGADYTVVVTHDATMARVAGELGFDTLDPVVA